MRTLSSTMMLWLAVLCLTIAASGGSEHHRRDHRMMHHKKSSCEATLERAGLTKRFPGAVAHGIHSLSVDDLKMFEPSVTEKNTIPTVNLDLKDEPAVLPNAPDMKMDSPFKTTGLRSVDKVLSHMDDKSYDVKQYTALERLVHSLHMIEVWYAALPHYQTLKREPPMDENICRCVKDVDNNGVMKMLRFIALKVREPELMYGVHTRINGGQMDWSGNLYNYGFFPMTDEDIELPKKEDVIPPLRNEAAWDHWKKIMMGMKSSDDYELALFLYCQLNE